MLEYKVSRHLSYKHRRVLLIRLWIRGYVTIILHPGNLRLIQYSHVGTTYLNRGSTCCEVSHDNGGGGTFLSRSTTTNTRSFVLERCVVQTSRELTPLYLKPTNIWGIRSLKTMSFPTLCIVCGFLVTTTLDKVMDSFVFVVLNHRVVSYSFVLL